ncbi:hypothetical protein SLEP1_g51862 [Rubroshorea leprosula]|uniref:Uncharacterized protein n=1 Tax=Rubroshorea leprosula TaxID=152421 RepID=A0AAV5M755_9ROSI|nr:hypothetical protein SLEP1_g51862 [Rubroshorea leprosula]
MEARGGLEPESGGTGKNRAGENEPDLPQRKKKKWGKGGGTWGLKTSIFDSIAVEYTGKRRRFPYIRQQCCRIYKEHNRQPTGCRLYIFDSLKAVE